MKTYRIVMTTGIVHEVESKNEINALNHVWKVHYECWDFVSFMKKVEKTIKL